jgi:hypothetical protein
MNQIARGGYDPTPLERGAPQGCRKPHSLRGQIPPFSRTSKEVRTADTATLCQTLKALQNRIEPWTFRSGGGRDAVF